MTLFDDFYRGRRVLVTGHTGFKGAWLCEWLLDLGAEVTGYSRDVPSVPSLFDVLGHPERVRDIRGDVRDLDALRAAMGESRPEVVFHLAAQSLVRVSYRDPVETFATNVLGTVHVLEVARTAPGLLALVNVTSDKCYENQGFPFGYRETDPMGGADPYSASKGCAELVFSAYQRSYLAAAGLSAASARAGNVIGGGDWAADRLIPDCARAWSKGEVVTLRNPQAIRPWQHVLEPLAGYLELGRALGDPTRAARIAGQGFNLGPDSEAFESVEVVVRAFQEHWPSVRYELLPDALASREPHEAHVLKLACDKARAMLGVRPRLRLSEALELTASWYKAYQQGESDMRAFTVDQLRRYAELTRAR
jgi:CDP-glucose 4,6-dehydratase